MRSDRDGQNHYYQVVEPFRIEVVVGHVPANVYIGSSRAWQALYETVTVRPGDELHRLVGGDFLVRAGVALPFTTRQHEASDILLHPAPPDPSLPKTKLREVSAEAAHRPFAYRTEVAVGSRRTVPR